MAKGLFKNDVTNLGVGGERFCDTLCKDHIKTVILVQQRGNGVEYSKICVTLLRKSTQVVAKNRAVEKGLT